MWGFNKVRYRGLAKNTARLFTAFALANLYLLRRRLLPAQWTCPPVIPMQKLSPKKGREKPLPHPLSHPLP
jgi:hypothetical protein